MGIGLRWAAGPVLESASAPPRPPTKDRIEFSSDEGGSAAAARLSRSEGHKATAVFGGLREEELSRLGAPPTSVRGSTAVSADGWSAATADVSLALPSAVAGALVAAGVACAVEGSDDTAAVFATSAVAATMVTIACAEDVLAAAEASVGSNGEPCPSICLELSAVR